MYEFKFADIGEGIHEGIIHQWLVKEGDSVKDGQPLFLVETDKVTAEIPSPIDGIIESINFAVGQTIHVGQVAVVINDGKGHRIAVAPPKEVPHHVESVEEAGSTSVVGEIEVSSVVIASSEELTDTLSKIGGTGKVLATPVARKMAKDLAVDIGKLVGSGPSGRIMKADIQEAFDQRKEIVASDGDRRIKMTSMRKAIARNMVQSKFTIPHTACMDDVDVTELVKYRRALNEKFATEGIKLSYLPFILKAIAIALKKHPILNASLDEATDEIILKTRINIGIATDTPDGLTVPVIKDVDSLGILGLANIVKEKSQLAQNHQLTFSDLAEGTFTLTNYGSIGAKYGVPVIKFPEAAILGIGTIFKQPAVGHEGELVIQDTLPLSLSFDHRIIDGADAGRFLQTLKKLLSNPDLLLIS